VLLCGGRGAGKSLAAEAAAAAAGAAIIDLTPSRTDTLPAFSGKAGATMLAHKAFKVAKALAPSIILIDAAETLLSSDKKIIGGGTEPYNRLKKDIFKEAAALVPSDRVIVLALTSDPAAAAGKEVAVLGAAFDAVLHIPPPDDAARRALWPALARTKGIVAASLLDVPIDWASVALLSEGCTPGEMLTALRAASATATAARRGMRTEDVLNAVAALGPRAGAPVAEKARTDVVDALRAASAAARVPGAAPPAAAGAKKKK
jgi:SpoVK/Ycf46/Vps4 family AAA+-type ATPase